MDISTAFPSKYLRAADLPEGKNHDVTIDRVEMEDIDGDQNSDKKPVVYFTGKKKGLVLNKTNATTISDAYGVNTDTWPGKPLLLYSTKTEFRGKRVACIRIDIPTDQKKPEPQSDGTEALQDGDIPF